MLGIATSWGGNTTDLGLVIRAFALIQFNTKDFIFKKLRFALLTEFASSLNGRFFMFIRPKILHCYGACSYIYRTAGVFYKAYWAYLG